MIFRVSQKWSEIMSTKRKNFCFHRQLPLTFSSILHFRSGKFERRRIYQFSSLRFFYLCPDLLNLEFNIFSHLSSLRRRTWRFHFQKISVHQIFSNPSEWSKFYVLKCSFYDMGFDCIVLYDHGMILYCRCCDLL